MIDLMLQDARVPTGGFNHYRFRILIEAFDSRPAGPRDNRTETGNAEAAFKEFELRSIEREDRVDDHGEWNRFSIAFRQGLRIERFELFFAVFNNGELKRQPDLRSGKTNSGRVIHGLTHKLD